LGTKIADVVVRGIANGKQGVAAGPLSISGGNEACVTHTPGLKRGLSSLSQRCQRIDLLTAF